MIRDWFINGRFQSINLLCASTAALLLYFSPSIGGWPLILFIVPWILAVLVQRRLPFRHTTMDWFLLLFAVTAVVGVLTAYNTAIALTQFWLILGAILLFYAITVHPAASASLVAGAVCVLATIVSGYFLLTHNWLETPASITSLQNITSSWVRVRPTIPSLADPNAAEGIMVMTFPLLLAQILWAVKMKHKIWLTASVLAACLVLIGLLFSTSRGVWVALLTGLSFWVLWPIGVRFCQHLSKKGLLVFFGLLSVGFFIGFSLLYNSDISARIIDRLAGMGDVGDRLQVAQGTLDLIEDFLFTGGGLGAFSGLYSHYILVIPYHFLAHSHDIFLDIMLEQGLIGLLAFVGVFGMTVLFLFMPQSRQENTSDRYHYSYLRCALAASLIALIVHGFVDDPLYSSEGMVFLFLIPGMAVWQYRPGPQGINWYHTKWVPGLLAVSIILVAVAAAFYKPVSARWQANLGAVEMAKVELRTWPNIEWNDSRNAVYLAAAEAHFDQALADNSGNRTANYRLGLIQMLRHDYVAADSLLERAYEIDPKHKGVKKSLGYSYVWAGEPDLAHSILAEIPEAYTELNTYAWWWQTQGYDDLAQKASLLADEME